MKECPFAKYSKLFGETGKGVHSFRVFDISVFDVLVTIIVGLIISKYSHLDWKVVLPLFFLSGIIIHRLFCVKTKIDRIIFGE